MAGNKAGGRKQAQTILKKYGPDFWQNTGRLGGLKKVKKGFATFSKEKVSAAGTKGGSISRRGKAK